MISTYEPAGVRCQGQGDVQQPKARVDPALRPAAQPHDHMTLSNNNISELKNGLVSGLSLLKRPLWSKLKPEALLGLC